MGATILIRETRFHCDKVSEKSEIEIQRALADPESMLVTPAELAKYMFSTQTYRVRFDRKFIQHAREKRDARREEIRAMGGEVRGNFLEAGGAGGPGGTAPAQAPAPKAAAPAPAASSADAPAA